MPQTEQKLLSYGRLKESEQLSSSDNDSNGHVWHLSQNSDAENAMCELKQNPKIKQLSSNKLDSLGNLAEPKKKLSNILEEVEGLEKSPRYSPHRPSD